MRGMPGRALLALATGAVLAPLARRLVESVTPPGTLIRRNHAGRPVSLAEGPAYVGATALAGVLAGPAAVVAAIGAGSFGALDDFAGDSRSKGLRGHLGALSRGVVTTGLVKVAGLGATGLLAARLADRERSDLTGFDTLVGVGVVAGGANVANLLDLRPGRALKATLVTAALTGLADGRALVGAAAASGAAAALIGSDLRGRTMLGDTGANAAGAVIGTALVMATGRRGRLAVLGVVTALTLASERVSFTTVIESTPVLRELDRWGRS